MKTFETVKTTREELVELSCDKCGLMSKKHGALPAGVNPYIDTVSIYFGYGSQYDQDLWEIDLCEKCIENTFGDIKKSVYTNEIGE